MMNHSLSVNRAPWPKLFGNAADEEAGVEAVVLEHPGQQRGGGGFAVRAGHDQRTLAADEKLLEQLRQRTITQLVIQHRFRLRIAARNGVADHHQVGLVGQVLLRVAGITAICRSARNVDIGG